jgi:hypothetical protein
LWLQYPTNCKVSIWSKWSACSEDCTRSKTRSIITPPSRNGDECPALIHTETCTAPPCKSPKHNVVATVSGLKRYIHNASMLEHQLAHMTTFDLTASDKVAFAAQGGISALVAVMQRHPLVTTVQAHACGALWNLAYESQPNQVLVWMHMWGGLGGVMALFRWLF